MTSPRQLDPRLNAYRADLADARLRGTAAASRYVSGRPARVVAGLAPVRRGPSPEAETLTHYHYGEPVLAFDTAAGWAWCQSGFDDYVGYIEADRLTPGNPPAATHFVATMGSYRYAAPDLRSPVIDFLPRHSAVAIAETGLLTRGTAYARLDSGGHVPLGCLSAAPPRSSGIVAAAALYLGCPYLWGGRSFVGIDCSGLVQNAFRDVGVAVPRDTDLQRDAIGEGIPVGRVAELRPGDLIYLPGHVMIYAGNGAVIHADGGTMVVRRDDLTALMQHRSLAFDGFTVRRP